MNSSIIKTIHQNIRKLEEINVQAIVRKNDKAQASVKEAILYMGLLGSFTFLVIFSFIITLPGFIVNPLLELTKGIKEISRKNYQKRLDFPNYNEFGILAEAFNQMASIFPNGKTAILQRLFLQSLGLKPLLNKCRMR